MNIAQQQNKKVLETLARRKRDRNHLLGKSSDLPAFAAWNSVPDTYNRCGCHPEIVEHLWDKIGKALPTDCRGLVHGTPALVHSKSWVILALGEGTQYSLRLPGLLAATAIKYGAKTSMRWSTGDYTDIQEDYGEDWVFGAFSRKELIWCLQVYDMFDHEAK